MSQAKRDYIVTVLYTIQATSKDEAIKCAKAITEDNGASISTPNYSWHANAGWARETVSLAVPDK